MTSAVEKLADHIIDFAVEHEAEAVKLVLKWPDESIKSFNGIVKEGSPYHRAHSVIEGDLSRYPDGAFDDTDNESAVADDEARGYIARLYHVMGGTDTEVDLKLGMRLTGPLIRTWLAKAGIDYWTPTEASATLKHGPVFRRQQYELTFTPATLSCTVVIRL